MALLLLALVAERLAPLLEGPFLSHPVLVGLRTGLSRTVFQNDADTAEEAPSLGKTWLSMQLDAAGRAGSSNDHTRNSDHTFDMIAPKSRAWDVDALQVSVFRARHFSLRFILVDRPLCRNAAFGSVRRSRSLPDTLTVGPQGLRPLSTVA